jgi:hypothetical protein
MFMKTCSVVVWVKGSIYGGASFKVLSKVSFVWLEKEVTLQEV